MNPRRRRHLREVRACRKRHVWFQEWMQACGYPYRLERCKPVAGSSPGTRILHRLINREGRVAMVSP